MEASILQIALPYLAKVFEVTPSASYWLLTTVSISCAITIPLAGFASHNLGTKKLWLLSQVIFFVSTLLCGFCTSFTLLLICRIFQGIAFGFMSPLLASVLVEQLGPQNFRAALGTTSISVALGHFLGIVIGGWLIEYCHWSLLFWANLPISLAGILLTLFWFKATAPTTGKHYFDTLGFILIALPMGSLSMLLNPDTTSYLNSILVAFVCLIIFSLYALKKRHHAILDVRIFAKKQFAPTVGTLSLVYFLMFTFSSFLPFYFAHTQNLSAHDISTVFLFFALGNITSRLIQEKICTLSSVQNLVRCIALTGCILSAYVSYGLQQNIDIAWTVICFIHGLLCGLLVIILTGQIPQLLPKADLKDGLTLMRVTTQVATLLGFIIPACLLKNPENYSNELHTLLILTGSWFIVLFLGRFFQFQTENPAPNK